MNQLKNLIGSLSARQIWTILAAFVAVAGGMYGFVVWQREAGFKPLYNGLVPEDAATVVQKLKEGGTPYRLANNGSTINVPEDRVAELRLELASAGVPKSGRIGFEIFDKTNFGMTDFAERVNFRRALEGELERSVMAISEVEQARVHISFPQDSVYTDTKQPAKASVLIKIKTGDVLPDSAVPAITHLVASAVEGLAPEAVSVLDMRGNLLNRAKRTALNGTTDSSDAALEYRHQVEQDLTTKLETTLEPLVGSGKFRVAVSADCDMSSGEQSEESYDPNRSVMVSSQRTDDNSTPGRVAGGVPGTASNLPDSSANGRLSGPGTTRHTENINYQSSRTVKHVVLPQGNLRRLSISVLLDQETHMEGAGADAKRVLAAPSPERMKVIHDLVSAAVGLNIERGDQLIVESLPFESTLNLDTPALKLPVVAVPQPAEKKMNPVQQIKSNPRLMILSGVGVAAVLALGFIVMNFMKRGGSQTRVVVREAAALPSSAPPPAAPAVAAAPPAGDAWVPSPERKPQVLPPSLAETLTTQLRENSKKDAEVLVGVLRGWLKEERT